MQPFLFIRSSASCMQWWRFGDTGLSVQETSSGDQFRRPVQETSSGDQFRRPVQETSSGDQFRRPVQETSSGDQFRRPVQETSSADRSCQYSCFIAAKGNQWVLIRTGCHLQVGTHCPGSRCKDYLSLNFS